MPRDLRDAELVGAILFLYRTAWPEVPFSQLADKLESNYIPNYKDGPYMSADPAEHHSKTPQHEGDLTA